MTKRFMLCRTTIFLFILVGCQSDEQSSSQFDITYTPTIFRQTNTCPETSDPWGISWLIDDQDLVISNIDAILTGTGLKSQGENILKYSYEYKVNPAFAISMFRKEASLAALGTRASRNNNPGNIIATGDCRGLEDGTKCTGYYGEISTDERFGVYSDMEDGVRAYFELLASEYKPGSTHNCSGISCIISAYCPQSECDTVKYTSQIKEWTEMYQCMILGIKQPSVFTPKETVPSLSVTIDSAEVSSNTVSKSMSPPEELARAYIKSILDGDIDAIRSIVEIDMLSFVNFKNPNIYVCDGYCCPQNINECDQFDTLEEMYEDYKISKEELYNNFFDTQIATCSNAEVSLTDFGFDIGSQEKNNATVLVYSKKVNDSNLAMVVLMDKGLDDNWYVSLVNWGLVCDWENYFITKEQFEVGIEN